jgi:hypothetical protein
MKRSSETWFNRQASNYNRKNVSSAPATVRAGNNGGAGRRSRKDEDGKEFFIVGKTTIGGEEIVG